MAEHNKISVVINTYNASRYLQEVLESVKGFDEILICDMESTDDTRQIAERIGCKVMIFPKKDHKICEPARDFAIHSASCPWVFVVDADEIVPDTLREYLYQRIDCESFVTALAVPRINLFMGKPVKNIPDYQLRFFLKENAYWPPVIHARPKIKGNIENIPFKPELSLRHLDNSSISQRVEKMNVYTDYEVPKRASKRYSILQMLGRPVWFFLKTYLIRREFTEGKRGLAKAFMTTMYEMMKMMKIIEYQQDKQNGQK